MRRAPTLLALLLVAVGASISAAVVADATPDEGSPVLRAADGPTPASTSVDGTTFAATDGEDPCTGTIAEPATGTTVVSVQGIRVGEGDGVSKTTPRLVAVGPRGTVRWVHEAPDEVVFLYDVDPLENGNLFVVGTFREDGHGKTMLFEFDPRTKERVWATRLNITDTHDADVLDEHRIAIARMRAYDGSTGENEDGLLVYNRTTDEVEQSWSFDADGGYPREAGGPYGPDPENGNDWTHLNDVDRIGEDRYLLSPRNFDQVVVVNLATDEIELQLGADGDHDTLERQHNPQYLEAEDGSATILVADSDNDRIVEYERTDDGWERTWLLGPGQGLDWPRDADRLPNGNTLVVDSRNDRVLEVTPEGEVVWETYAPWLPYDAERVHWGDEAGDAGLEPIADMDAGGSVAPTNDRRLDTEAKEACDEYLAGVDPDEVGSVASATDAGTASTPSPTAASTAPTIDVSPRGVGVVGALAALVALVGAALLRSRRG